MNIKEYFNFKLCLQAIKHLKVVGIVSGACLGMFALFAPILTYLSNDYDNIIYLFAPLSYFEALYTVVYFIVPLMSMTTFKFLRSRNGSDFYHSLPVKRTAMYLSFLAAIITWALILIAGFTIIHCTVHIILPIDITINYTSIFIFTCNIFICCILVAAVFGLGCSLSGTTASNMFTSLNILLAPRILLSIFCALVASANYLILGDGMLFLTRYKCNMVIRCLIEPFTYEYNYTGLRDYTLSTLDYSTLYTLILAILYIILGCFVFYKRPSEADGKATFSTKLQFALRMTIGYTISIIVMIPMYTYFNYDSLRSLDIEELIFVFVVYTVSFIGMFIYELVTLKSMKKALKSFVTAPLVIVANIVTVIILGHIEDDIKSYAPDADDISYVKIQFDYRKYDEAISSLLTKNGMESMFNNRYDNSETIIDGIANMKITDSEIIEYASELLALSVKRKNDGLTGHNPYPSYYISNDVVLTIKDGIFETERLLYITYSEFETLIELLMNYEKTYDIYKSFPEEKDVFSITSVDFMTETQNREIYSAFIKDLKNITPYEYHHSIYAYENVYNLWFYYNKNGMVYYDILPVTYATPNAMALFLKYCNQHNNADLSSLYNKIITSEKCLNGDISLTVKDFSNRKTIEYRENFVSENPANNEGFNILKDLSSLVNQHEYNANNNVKVNIDDFYLCKINIYSTHSPDNSGPLNCEYYFLIEKHHLKEDLLKKFDSTN